MPVWIEDTSFSSSALLWTSATNMPAAVR